MNTHAQKLDETQIATLEEDRAYALVGRAISSWSRVENELMWLFSALAGDGYTIPGGGRMAGGASTTVFNAVESLNTRLVMIDRLIVAILGNDEDAEEVAAGWATLKKKTQKFAVRRNRLAHWSMMHLGDRPAGRRYVLLPPPTSRQYHIEAASPGGGLSSHDVAALVGAFGLLAKKLSEFGTSIGGRPALIERRVNEIGGMIHNISNIEPDFARDLALAAVPPHLR